MFEAKFDINSSERLTIDKINDDGCLNLLEMFLEQLAEDYRLSLFDYMRNQKDVKSKKAFVWMRKFIKSKYFASLTGLDSEEVIDALDGKYKYILEGLNA